MILAPFRRSTRSRLLKTLVAAFLIWNFLDVFRVRWNLQSSRESGATNLSFRKEKVYIASTHWNNEAILRSHWNAAVVALAEALGPDNVYVSVYESGSWDDSKGALNILDAQLERLGVRRTIVLDETTHADEIAKLPASTGWINTPRGKQELRRIPYLSRLRNLTLKPLEEMAALGERFDKILFLNDVVFTTQDIFTLLNTNNGQYAAACSLDFSKPPNFYDTFALRDSEGHEPLTQTWPYFRSQASRHAIKSNRPVPVASCWNGIAVMDSKPFYNHAWPLRFRGIPDSLANFHLEGSECCLIHADNPLSSMKGVWLNPNVRVGYNGPAYDAVHKGDSGISTYDIFIGLWRNRFRRWMTTTWFKSLVVNRRLRAWQAQSPDTHSEPGRFCLVNEMQVLVSNGWAHV